MIFQSIDKRVAKSPRYQDIVTAFLFLLLTTVTASASISPDEFSSAVAGVHSPQVEISLPSLPLEPSALNDKIIVLKDSGFGGIFLTSIPAGSNSWKRIASVADCCRRNSMKLGCDFFPQEEQIPSLFKVVWTNRIVDAVQLDNYSSDSDPLRENERLICNYRIPLAFSNNIQQALAPGYKAPSAGEKCYEFSFKAIPVDPFAINYFDKDVFEHSVNKFLLNAQFFLHNNYGTVLDTIRFPSIPGTELVWSDNLQKLFKKDVDFDLVRNLPALVLGKNSDALHIKNIRERYSRGIKRFWIENFADNVRPLVHEAGLHAALSVNESPLPAEELGSFFRYPVAIGSTNMNQRVVNSRMSGGARIYGSSPVNGWLQVDESFLRTDIDFLFIDGATRIIFSENIVSRSFDKTQFDSIKALCGYVNRCSYLLQNSEPSSGIFLYSNTIPQLMNRCVFDFVTPRILTDSEIKGGKIVFASGRSSPVIVFSDDALKRSKALVGDLASSGVKVLPVADIGKVMPDFTWKSDAKTLNLSFVRRSGLSYEIFMVKNESNVNGQADLIFKIDNFTKISRWQPQDGKIVPINNFKKITPAQCQITMTISDDDLFFVVFDHE